MTESQIGWLMLLLLGGFGALMALAGILIIHIKKKRCSLCTEKTTGIVVKHRYQGNGIVRPIVEYTVGETRYKVAKDFRGIRTKSITGLPNTIQAEAWEDEKGWLNIKRGSFVSYGQLAEDLWPIGSETTVYYNPEKPKMRYVERPVTVDFESIMFICFGIAIIGFGVLGFFLNR